MLKGNDSAHAHAVTNAGSNTYSYDNNGNQTTRVIGGQTYTLGYDAENRLISISGAVTASFVYDGDGRQVKSVVNGVTTYLVGAHYHVENGQVTKYYFAGAQRVAMRKNGTLSYMLSDHLGSTLGITNTSGTLTAGTLYKAWGETRYTLGTVPTKFKYTGQREESAFGLYFYNARWYDPVSGRFAQADTIVPAEVQGLDRHAYVNNSPMVYVDPTGHFTEDAIKEYLRGYCENEKACYESMLEQWQADTEWWDMLSAAQAGDVLFGTSTCCYMGGGMTDPFTFTFTGDGDSSLTGITYNTGASTDTTLVDIQGGVKVTGTSSDGSITFGQTFNWIGFYRTDSNGKPSYWHTRPGYEVAEGAPAYSGYTNAGNVGAFVLGTAACYSYAGPASVICGAAAWGASELLFDALDIQEQDYHVQVGPVYFNFQSEIVPGSTPGSPANNWTLEKVR